MKRGNFWKSFIDKGYSIYENNKETLIDSVSTLTLYVCFVILNKNNYLITSKLKKLEGNKCNQFSIFPILKTDYTF